MTRFDGYISERAQKILLALLDEKEEVVKTSLLRIVSNSYSLDKHLETLQSLDLINIREEKIVRRTFYVSLTTKGRAVAEQLRKADDIASGVKPIEVSEKEARDFAKRFEEDMKGLSLLYHVNVFLDHITVGEEKNGRQQVINVYVKLNGSGIMRLWCEFHEAYECIHTQFAWTLPDVQEMVQLQKEKGNMK